MPKRVALSSLIVTVLTISSCSSATQSSPSETSTHMSPMTTTVVGTTSSRRVTPSGPRASIRAYERFGGCDEMLTWTKERLLERVTPYGIDPIGWMPGMEDFSPPVTEAAAMDAEPSASSLKVLNGVLGCTTSTFGPEWIWLM